LLDSQAVNRSNKLDKILASKEAGVDEARGGVPARTPSMDVLV